MGSELSAMVSSAGLPDGLSPILADFHADALEAGISINWGKIIQAIAAQIDWAKLIQAILDSATSKTSANGDILRKLLALLVQYAPQIFQVLVPVVIKDDTDPTPPPAPGPAVV